MKHWINVLVSMHQRTNIWVHHRLFVRITITVGVYNMSFSKFWSTFCALCHLHDEKLTEYFTYVEKQARLQKQKQKINEAKKIRVHEWQLKFKKKSTMKGHARKVA